MVVATSRLRPIVVASRRGGLLHYLLEFDIIDLFFGIKQVTVVNGRSVKLA